MQMNGKEAGGSTSMYQNDYIHVHVQSFLKLISDAFMLISMANTTLIQMVHLRHTLASSGMAGLVQNTPLNRAP